MIYIAFWLPSVIAVGLGLYRLIPRLKYRGFVLELPVIVLAGEIFANLLRLVFAIDPLGMNKIFDPFNSIFWYTPNGAVALVCHFGVLFYWNRAMHSFGAQSIDWMKKYVYMLFALIFVVEIVSATLRSLEFVYAFLVLSQVFYVILELGMNPLLNLPSSFHEQVSLPISSTLLLYFSNISRM